MRLRSWGETSEASIELYSDSRPGLQVFSLATVRLPGARVSRAAGRTP